MAGWRNAQCFNYNLPFSGNRYWHRFCCLADGCQRFAEPVSPLFFITQTIIRLGRILFEDANIIK